MRRIMVFTKDQLSALLHANGKEGIMEAVNQIPEGELRNALVLAVTMYQQQTSVYEALLHENATVPPSER